MLLLLFVASLFPSPLLLWVLFLFELLVLLLCDYSCEMQGASYTSKNTERGNRSKCRCVQMHFHHWKRQPTKLGFRPLSCSTKVGTNRFHSLSIKNVRDLRNVRTLMEWEEKYKCPQWKLSSVTEKCSYSSCALRGRRGRYAKHWVCVYVCVYAVTQCHCWDNRTATCNERNVTEMQCTHNTKIYYECMAMNAVRTVWLTSAIYRSF